MSERNNLLRWNRAGLSRFRYIDGMAAEYLEILRQQLVMRFGWDLRLEVASATNPEDELLSDFESEFESKKNALAILIVREKFDVDKWTVAGYDDNGEFKKVVVDSTDSHFSNELLAEYIDDTRIIELAAESLGRTQSNKAEDSWLKPAVKIPFHEKEPENESLIQRQERLSKTQERVLQMYYQDRRDWAWEITRTFARACNILTEHVNAYANEGYIGTATQWDNLRRLVEMLDYHPAPPASAYTRLVIIAKEGKRKNQNITENNNNSNIINSTSILKKGFQVKYTPPEGGDKIIFETLEDLIIDPALNSLRPKDWDKSEDSPLKDESNSSTTPPSGEPQPPAIVNGPAINIQGVGPEFAKKLNQTEESGEIIIKKKVSRIIDFAELEPDDSGLQINPTLLWEWKTKAEIIINFSPEGDWYDLADWLLPDIAGADTNTLAELSSNSVKLAESLKQEIQKIAMCLDQPVFNKTKLSDLITLEPVEQGMETFWKAARKPSVNPGDVAMVYREYRDENGKDTDEAEAATIAGVDRQTQYIRLTPGSLPAGWTKWSRSEALLKVSPRWKRECWLNGDDVIRTVEPHGLTADSYICWKIDYSLDVDENLKDTGKSLVSIAVAGDVLSVRIFNEKGEIVIDKSDSEEETDLNKMLIGDNVIKDLKDLNPELLNESRLSAGEKQKILDNAMKCAGYTDWKFAKVKEADKRSLRLEVNGPLPESGEEIYVLSPIEGNVYPANYEAVVLLGGEDVPPESKQVAPGIEDEKKPLFCLKNILVNEFGEEDSGGGGGLLPPASLPKIGSFLFPSPMLPMDLVKAAVELLLSFGIMVIPSTGEIVIKGMPFSGMLEDMTPELAADALFDMLDKLEGPVQKHNSNCDALWQCTDGVDRPYSVNNDALFIRDADGELTPAILSTDPATKVVEWNQTILDEAPEGMSDEDAIKAALKEMLTLPEGEEATVLFQKITEDITGKGPLLAINKEPVVKAVVQESDPLYMFDGSSKIGVGDWVVAKFPDELLALKVSNIQWYTDEDDTETFSLKFENPDGTDNELTKALIKVYADFRGSLIAEEASVNTAEIKSGEIELDEVPDSIKVGREVLLTAEGKDPVAAKIESIDGNIIKTSPPAAGYTKGDLIICGNVVLAGHGESKPEKILGSGNAAKNNQEFIIEVADISFPPDKTKSSGVAAALDVIVSGRIWEQVSTLKDSGPGDHHYAVRMTEEGYVKIIFGDGENGRRLPTGKNNVRAVYRVGTGIEGNVSAGSLVKIAKPNPLVESVQQPIQAAGGGDMEDTSSLRENAPSSLLALERAVSLSDFEHLAASQSSVWQAKAYSEILYQNKVENVRVVIVPAGGETSGDVEKEISGFLRQHTLPGVHVTVEDCERKYVSLRIILRINTSRFNSDEVKSSVTSAVKNNFALKNRKLGEHLFLSEVYKIVEGIRGVENSICILNGSASLKLVKAEGDNMIICVDTNNGSTLEITHEEYQK